MLMERLIGGYVLLLSLFAACQPNTQEKAIDSRPNTVASFDGTEIHFEQAGQGDTVLVFVHGWCIDGTYWQQQVEHFSPRFQTLTIDLAGHGQSANRAVHTMEAFGKDVQSVVETLDLKKVILIGHSMSEMTVLEAAIGMPDRVLGILGVDTFVDPTEKTSDEDKNNMLTAFEADFPGTVEAFLGDYIAPETDSAIRAAILNDISEGPPGICTEVMEAIVDYSQSGVYVEQLKRLTVPIRTINVYPPNLEAWAATYQDFGAIEIAGVGHYPMLEKGELLNEKLEEALLSLR
jgi:pimeloyl-ACP methyl ester carboxylesterase